jgi:phage gp45-like
MMYGAITAARPPEDPLNVNKYQYEYDVDCDGEAGTKVPVRHVIAGDLFGSLDEYEDRVFRPANRVVVIFPDDRLNNGIIVCCLRNNARKMARDLGPHHEQRYNKVTDTVDKDGHWTKRLDQGERVQMTKQKITITNANGEEVVIDRASKSILVKAGKDWKTTLGGSMQVDAAESVTVNCKNATVNAQQNITAKAGKKVEVSCEEATIKAAKKAKVETSEAEVNASKKAVIKGGEIILNEGISPITTEISHLGVVDLITGVPVQGVKKIKAG